MHPQDYLFPAIFQLSIQTLSLQIIITIIAILIIIDVIIIFIIVIVRIDVMKSTSITDSELLLNIMWCS